MNGADRPASGAMFGMYRVGVSSAVPNRPSRPGLVMVAEPGFCAAAATAAGLLAVLSTIRLLMVRGWVSNTLPVVWA
ncbi:hypothetical protein D3C80_2143100 [compost metagenome]